MSPGRLSKRDFLPSHKTGANEPTFSNADTVKDTTRKIAVTLKLFKQAFPERQIVNLPQGACVRDLMAILEPKFFKPEKDSASLLPTEEMSRNDLLLILNGQLINNLKGFDTPLKDGDVFSVFPVMSGG